MRRIAAGIGIVAFLAVLGSEVVSVVVLSCVLLPTVGWLLKEMSEHNF